MAYSYVTYTGNGSTTQFSVPFGYIRKEHVYVNVNQVSQTFAWVNANTVQLATAPVAGAKVEVRRSTPAASPLVDFTDGSTPVAADFDTSNLQHLYLEQELQDNQFQTVSVDPATGLPTLSGSKLTNVGNPTNAQDAATKSYVDGFVSQTANIADSAVTTAKVADGAITSAKIADGTIAAADLASNSVTTAKIADGSATETKLASDSVSTAKIVNSAVTTAKVADGSITEAKLAADAVTVAKIKDGEITSAKLNPATVITNAEVAGVSPNDTSFYTTSASDQRYFRQDSSETINSGMAWSGSDSFIATTAAIDARIIDLVDDVGGFVPIANETSFPATNPDINNPDGTGTIISVKEIVTTRTPASGTVTIANGSGGNTVTITGCGSTVLAAGFGVLVETTATLHTYAFHRLVPKATEVTTVASISGNVTTVAGISGNVTTVATNNANVTTVASNIADIQTVAADLNEAVSEIDTVATNIANVNTVGNGIANVNTVAGNNANITTVAGSIANVNTTAGNIANVNTVGGAITNVNNVGSNIANVNTCATNIAAITAAPTQAANAAASATAAANSASAASSLVTTITNLNYLLNWGLITQAAGTSTDYGAL